MISRTKVRGRRPGCFLAAWFLAMAAAGPVPGWGTSVPSLLGARHAAAQPVPARLPPFQNAALFAPLELPLPTPYRTASGAPGEAYWQQRADYRIQVRLDPRSHRISGSQTIVYTNNSPDTLRSLWFQLDQNLFRPGTPEAEQVPEGARFAGAFRGGGFDISRVAVARNGRHVEAVPAEAALGPGPTAGGAAALPTAGSDDAAEGPTALTVPAYRIEGTVMEVMLDEPLSPEGGRLELHLDFAFTVPESGADRMGREKVRRGTVYQIAQWYPRMFVYDDANGWNVMPYLGQGEFYLEYGTFEVEITAPRDFVVLGTGVLQNPEEVYTEEQVRRLAEARRSSETVSIIGLREAGRSGSRPEGEGPLTWKFLAEDVRDFAWAASEVFLLDGASWGDVLVLSAYPPEGVGEFSPGWERAAQLVRHSVRHFSEKWHPYPYPVAIAVAGPVLGMEYPMMVFVAAGARDRVLFWVLDHEVAHFWFPMLVGSDERRHAWMDEGFATFMSTYSEREFFGELSPGNAVSPDVLARRMASEVAEKPVFTEPDRLAEEELGFLAYDKPAAALTLLRDYVLGPERFDPAFREYIRRWAGRHPQPADFFRTVEDVTGEDLAWFWRGWILETGRLDQAVGEVRRAGDTTYVVVENRGELVMPLEVRLIYLDGGDECRRIPVTVWLPGDAWTGHVVGREVQNVHLDPRGMLPDVNGTNNVWGRGVVVRRDTC